MRYGCNRTFLFKLTLPKSKKPCGAGLFVLMYITYPNNIRSCRVPRQRSVYGKERDRRGLSIREEPLPDRMQDADRRPPC